MNRVLWTIFLASVLGSMQTASGIYPSEVKHQTIDDVPIVENTVIMNRVRRESVPIIENTRIMNKVRPTKKVEEIEEVMPEPDPMLDTAKSLGYEGYYIQMVEVSAYCPCVYCTGEGLGITADGSKVEYGMIAAPPEFSFGTQMIIEGFDTIFTVRDRGGAIFMKDDGVAKLDVYVDTHEEALQIGRFQVPAYVFY